MSAAVIELLDLVARWVHVVAGIMWVGNSLLFNWLDRSLRPSSRPGSIGDIWLLHSGGFYEVRKTLDPGRPMPSPVHWFKWQAYTTWLSGAALLLVVYYLGGRALLVDPAVAALGHDTAVLIALGAIVTGWALYEAMQRAVAPRAPRLATAIWITGLTAIAIALTALLAGRAAFLHVGAMLGTIMAGNVLFTIVPSQRELVAAVDEGRGARQAISDRAKRVSIHNNYFAFPVIVLMLSTHFPSVYSGRYDWLMMLVLIGAGAAVRHILNARFTWAAWRPALVGTMTASIGVLWALAGAGTDHARPAPDETGPVSFAEARRVIERRCAVCHSAAPADATFGAAPGGASFDSPEQMAAYASRIRERAVDTRTMPPANKTNITDAERALLGRWIAAGAPLLP